MIYIVSGRGSGHKQETQKINEAGLPEDERHAALQQLLHKETKLLQTIVRLKIAANAENRDVRIAHTLSDMSAPKTWEVSDGTTVEVHTPFTTRAKELMQLYNGLRLPLLSTGKPSSLRCGASCEKIHRTSGSDLTRCMQCLF